jgi:hypothetical protein
MTQDTMIEHSIESAVACPAVSLYIHFELQHVATVLSPLAVHIYCSWWSMRNKAVTIMSARNISWIGLLILHPSCVVTVGANTSLEVGGPGEVVPCRVSSDVIMSEAAHQNWMRSRSYIHSRGRGRDTVMKSERPRMGRAGTICGLD